MKIVGYILSLALVILVFWYIAAIVYCFITHHYMWLAWIAVCIVCNSFTIAMVEAAREMLPTEDEKKYHVLLFTIIGIMFVASFLFLSPFTAILCILAATIGGGA